MKTQRDKYAESFADYLVETMERTNLRQAQVAERSNLSRQTISQLVNKKPHRLTGKLILPERETVEAIARALGDDPAAARKAAGYSDESPVAEQPKAQVEFDETEYFIAHAQPIFDLINALPRDIRPRVLKSISIFYGTGQPLPESVTLPDGLVLEYPLNFTLGGKK